MELPGIEPGSGLGKHFLCVGSNRAGNFTPVLPVYTFQSRFISAK